MISTESNQLTVSMGTDELRIMNNTRTKVYFEILNNRTAIFHGPVKFLNMTNQTS